MFEAETVFTERKSFSDNEIDRLLHTIQNGNPLDGWEYVGSDENTPQWVNGDRMISLYGGVVNTGVYLGWACNDTVKNIGELMQVTRQLTSYDVAQSWRALYAVIAYEMWNLKNIGIIVTDIMYDVSRDESTVTVEIGGVLEEINVYCDGKVEIEDLPDKYIRTP